jgi:hypothetical protein
MLAFQLTDGSGLDDGNTTVTVDDFSISLTDNAFVTWATQDFTPGGLLSFTVAMNTCLAGGDTPDAFAISILDGAGWPIPTLDPSGAETLLAVDIDSPDPLPRLYAADSGRTLYDGSTIAMNAPRLDGGDSTPVPEPGSFILLATALAACAAAGRRMRRKVRRP